MILQTELDKFESSGGEPWHVTQQRYVDIMSAHFIALKQTGDKSEWQAYHESAVQEALNEGKEVSALVKADYPNMRAVSKEEEEARYERTTKALNDLMNRAAGI